ncbi:MetQ/NlpA family ABC transporter substrate-binding protein [Sediminibacillus massiliensis]|uniref:MetQ/NlpA family ABC transporter substrate-binding protein n=1 Tax=Sediminibacillus massiliensis TaxID=1926277 RepID=UPI0009887843|nr:MetQ/NlpA family ABC transporter substrate-binding protein [Sediminibacillus massiliensis]
MKKLLFSFAALLLFIITGCGSDSETVKVGTSNAETPTWELMKELASEEGIELEIVQFSDYVQPNIALDNGEIDLNAFQTISYFNSFKEERELDLSAVGTTAIWPMGIYSEQVEELSEIEDGAQIIVPKEPTNLGRALMLMQKAELITLEEGFEGSGGLEAITENPKNLDIVPVTAGQTARGLQDATAALINSDVAIAAGLNPSEDPVFREDDQNVPYINIIASQTERKDEETFQKIVDIYHSEEVTNFIKEEYEGAAVPVIRPIEEVVGE